MSVTSQQVTRTPALKQAPARPGLMVHMRGLAGNHTLMRKHDAKEIHEGLAERTAQLGLVGRLPLQRKCACGGGSSDCTECKKPEKAMLQRSVSTSGIQPTLAVSSPGDIYEQEADQLAEKVMRMPEQSMQRQSAGDRVSQRVQMQKPVLEQPRFQTKRVGSNAGWTAAPPVVHDALRSRGQPLDSATRAFMEPRFGQDFSQVRIHSGLFAARSAREVNAHAYTVGHDIVFGPGQFAPGTQHGRQLIAHELTHVAQQTGANRQGVAHSDESVGPRSKGEARSAVNATPGAVTLARDVDETEKPSGTEVPVFLPLEGPLLNPGALGWNYDLLLDPEVLAADYALLSRVLGYGFDPLAARTRNISNRALAIAARVGIGGLATYLQLLPFVLSHELGHVREAQRQGLGTDLEYPKKHWYRFWSGGTSYVGSVSRPDPDLDSLLREAAGMNQMSLQNAYMYSESVRSEGKESLPYATANFLSKTNPFFYSFGSRMGWLPDDDVKDYIGDLSKRGVDLNPTTLTLLMGLTTAASGGVWGYGKGIGKYLWSGDLDFEVPTYSLGGVDWSHPDFRVLLSRGGPLVGAQTVANPRGSHPVELSADIGTHTAAAAITGKLFNFKPFGPRVIFNPFGGLSAAREFGGGFRLGTDVRIPIGRGFEVFGTGAVSKDFLHNELFGRKDLEFHFGVGLPLP